MSEKKLTQFTDDKGTVWKLDLTILDAKRLRDDHNIDILDTQRTVTRVNDELEAYELIHCIVMPHAESLGIDGKEFSDRFMEVASDAQKALEVAVVNFFLRLGRKKDAQLVETIGRARDEQDQKATALIGAARTQKAFTLAVNKDIATAEAAIDEIYGVQSKSSSESSESQPTKPTDSPTEN